MTSSEPISELYSRKILGFASDIPHLGHLENPDASGHAVSRLCGSEVQVDICVKDGLITAFSQEVKACALGQTSASVVGRHIIGASRAEINAAQAAMMNMLKHNGPAPDGRFADLEVLEPVRDYSARHASVMLVLDALIEAFDKLETGSAP